MALSSSPAEVDDGPRDTSPLLGPPSPSPSGKPTTKDTHYIRIVVLVTASVFLLEIGDFMMRAPTLRLMEDILCRQYYDSRDDESIDLRLPIPEDNCKIAPIQGELAMLRGWDTTFSCLPGILLAIPYGVMADKCGRKLVLMLGLGGLLLTLVWTMLVYSLSDVFNIRWVWFGNAFMVIGGGTSMIKAMYFAILADVVPEKNRSTVFFQITAVSLIATLIGVPVSWYLMEGNLFIPMWIGIGFFSSALPLIFFIPETLKRSKIPGSLAEYEYAAPVNSEPSSPQDVSIKGRFLKFCSETKEASFILKSPILLALSITFLFQSMGGRVIEYQYQLASERFHWKLKDASFLMPFGAVINYVVLVVALPYLYHVLTKHNISLMVKDLIVMRGSLVFLVAGSLIIALGPLPGIFILGAIFTACGAGLYPALRSLVTSLVHPDQVSRLYAIMAIGDTLGAMLYIPLIAKGFGWGMNIGGHWTGMAFLICTLMYVVVSIPTWLVKKPTEEMDVHG